VHTLAVNARALLVFDGIVASTKLPNGALTRERIGLMVHLNAILDGVDALIAIHHIIVTLQIDPTVVAKCSPFIPVPSK